MTVKEHIQELQEMIIELSAYNPNAQITFEEDDEGVIMIIEDSKLN